MQFNLLFIEFFENECSAWMSKRCTMGSHAKMVLELQHIKDGVVNRIGLPLLKRILKEVQLSPDALWATERPRSFVLGMIMITLYKDMTAASYSQLQKDIAAWCRMSNDGIQHNIKKCHAALLVWAKKVLVPQAPAKLARLASKSNRPEGLENVVLWIDSTDFRTKGKWSVHKEKARWSHKLKSPGRRWVTVTNVKGQAQWVSSAFLPSVFDGDITISCASELDRLFPGLEMVGDNHFRKASPFLKRLTLHTNISKAGRPRMVQGKKVPVELTPEEEEWNRKISLVRGKIEAPYGWVKRVFLSLDKPFYENEKQHDCVVNIALACHRLVIGKE